MELVVSFTTMTISGSRAPGKHRICGWVGPRAGFDAVGPEPHYVSSPTSNLIRTKLCRLLCDDTFRLPLVSTDRCVTSESMNRLGLNPRSNPYAQLRLFSNYSWWTFLRLRVLLLSASTVPSELDASRITVNYNACCYNKRYTLCVCGGGWREENAWLGAGYGGQVAGPCKHGKGTSNCVTCGEFDWLRNYWLLTDTAPWRSSAGWHTLW